MAGGGSSKSSERIQTAILTLFMTAGGFLLFTLVLSMWMNPSVDNRVDQAQSTYGRLAKSFQEREFIALRDQAKANAEQKNDQTPKEIIIEKIRAYGLDYTNIPPERRKPTGRKTSTQGPRTEEVSQKVDLEPAAMTPIVQFIAGVLGSKKSLRVDSVSLTRDRRNTSDRDSWKASIEFVDYVTPTSGG